MTTEGLILAPDTPIDLQLHTIYSDGTWTPELLLDHLIAEGFGLAAITDHDRVDITPMLQQIAQAKGLPLLVAAEMTTTWRGELTDLLCYGFDPDQGELNALALSVMQQQQQNSREVYDNLLKQGLVFPPEAEAEFNALLQTPAARQPHEFVAFLKKHIAGATGKMLLDAGLIFATSEPGAVIEAVHQGGGVCLIAHPGRTDGFNTFDVDLLDQFRLEFPVDGFEVYYPAHSPEQIAMYLDYAQKHDLLTSSGSDSHGSDRQLPIKYRAALSRKLLEWLGIQVK